MAGLPNRLISAARPETRAVAIGLGAGAVLVALAALGAALTDRLPLARLAPVGLTAGLLLAAWCGLEHFGLLLPADRLGPLPLAGRLALVAALLAVPGLTLGLPLPLLLRAAGRRYAERPVALLLAVHGAALAVGAAAAVVVALGLSMNANLLLAAGLFALLGLLARPVLAR